MIEFWQCNYQKILKSLIEHVEIVMITLIFALLLAVLLTIIAMYSRRAGEMFIQIFSLIYTIPSLAMFALLIPLTGLGRITAILVLTIYSQYLLLRNFITGLYEVEPAVVEAAVGLGMNPLQVLGRVRLPLAKRSLFTGIKLAVVSTISIATIAALINAGGLGDILFDGLRTLNVYKIVSGSILSAGLAFAVNGVLGVVEKRI